MSQTISQYESRRLSEYEAQYEDEPVVEESYFERRNRVRRERKQRRKLGLGG